MGKICRICTEKFNEKLLLEIFEIDINTELAPINYIRRITNEKFNVDENDGLPQQICKRCFNKLSEIYHFISFCEKSQVHLCNHFDYHPPILHEYKIKTESFDSTEETICDQPSEITINNFINESESSPNTLIDSSDYNHANVFNDYEFLDCIDTLDHTDNDNESDYWSDSGEIIKKLSTFICQYCKLPLSSYFKLVLHQKNRNCKKIPYSKGIFCEICGKNVSYNNILAHNNQHLGIRPYRCNICGNEYLRGSSYTTHMRHQHKNVPAECNYCNEKFPSFYHLDHHKNKEHPNEKNLEILTKPVQELKSQTLRYKCPFCPKQFRCLSLLAMHTKQHSKPEYSKHNCNECGSIFKRADHLKLHINSVHRKYKPYKCDSCPREFSIAADRNYHVTQAHSGKRYTCKCCNRDFKGSCSLSQHERRMKGILHFQCGFCNEKFLTTGKLQNHEKEKHVVNNTILKEMVIKTYKNIKQKPVKQKERETIDNVMLEIKLENI